MQATLRATAEIGDGGAAADGAQNEESARSAVNAPSAAAASAVHPKRASSGRSYNRHHRPLAQAATTTTGRHRDINR